MFADDLTALATAVVLRAAASGIRVAVAESCTGGLITGCLTEIPGASAVVERGFVTYTNEAKVEMLGVAASVIRDHGAVSAETAAAMAAGALAHAPADLAVAVTGIAGPGGATAGKPVGLVWFGLARRGAVPVRTVSHLFPGDRTQVRLAAVRQALALLAQGVLEASADAPSALP